jgi:hypothetical protein
MKVIRRGRKVDISGIDSNEIKTWIIANGHAKTIIKCQSIIALSNGIPMCEVCAVMGTTRESVRKWKKELRNHGLSGLVKEKKVGKRSRLTKEIKSELKIILKSSPKKNGYNKIRWTGLLLKNIVLKKWNLNIGIRTAQLWLKKI